MGGGGGEGGLHSTRFERCGGSAHATVRFMLYFGHKRRAWGFQACALGTKAPAPVGRSILRPQMMSR